MTLTIDKLAQIISAAQAKAAKGGFTKEWDHAIAFKCALDEQGYKIVRKPARRDDEQTV